MIYFKQMITFSSFLNVCILSTSHHRSIVLMPSSISTQTSFHHSDQPDQDPHLPFVNVPTSPTVLFPDCVVDSSPQGQSAVRQWTAACGNALPCAHQKGSHVGGEKQWSPDSGTEDVIRNRSCFFSLHARSLRRANAKSAARVDHLP